MCAIFLKNFRKNLPFFHKNAAYDFVYFSDFYMKYLLFF